MRHVLHQPRVQARHLSRLVFAACLCLAAEAHGERAGGISADVAIDDALRALERQGEHNSQLAGQLAALHEREQVSEEALRVHVRALYRITRSGSAPVASGFNAMRSYLARVRRLKSMVISDLAGVAAARESQSVTREQLRQGQRDLTAAQDQLAQLRETMSTRSGPLASRVESADTHSDRGFYGLRLSSGKAAFPFEKLHGKLAAPVHGELRLRDVQRQNASALLFETAGDTSVRASAAGRVVFCDGNTVVLDHGDGYQTAYGQLGNVEVQTGDEVSALARLGSVAAAPEPGLLFEIRKGARSLPPRPWLGL